VTTRTRYFLLQIPGWVLAVFLLTLLHRWMGLPLWAVVGGVVLYVIKDIALYPYLRRAYESTSSTGAERLIGETATVTRALQPEGYVQVGGDLWQARLDQAAEVAGVGSRVRVRGADGLVLIVSREHD
jgi:membrane protein implicated in regulation of membrane protease activity